MNEISATPIPVIKESVKVPVIPYGSTPASQGDAAEAPPPAAVAAPQAPAEAEGQAAPKEASEGEPGTPEGQEAGEGEQASEEKPDKMGARYAHLRKLEKQITDARSEIKREKEQLKKDMQLFQDLRADFDSVKQNPGKILQLLERFGVSYTDVAKSLLSENEQPPEEYSAKRVREELEAYKKQQQDEAARKQREIDERAVSNFKLELDQFIHNNSEKYELVELYDATQTVFEVIEEHYKQTGKLLSNDAACQLVEDHYTKEAEKVRNAKKFAPKESTANTVKDNTPDVRANISSKKLTNKNVSEATVPKKQKFSIEESKRKAAELLQWKD